MCFFAGSSCAHDRVSGLKTATIGATGVKLIRIVSKGGVLKVDGRIGDSVATVRGRALASSQRVLAQIGLTATRSGDVITIQPRLPRSSWFSWGNSLAMLDMSITVPAGIPIEITDGSGDIVVRGVGPVAITDGSGGIDVQGVTGTVNIRDGSGDINIRGVDGNVTVTDGSGGIMVANVTGDLSVPDDRSGSLTVERIGGSVHVRDKGSGALSVAHVGSDFTVGEKGSGSIRYEDVRGRVAVPSKQ